MKFYFLFLFFSLFITLSAKAEFYIESTSTGIVKIDGTGINKVLIGTECNYAVSYLNNAAFTKMKCPISEVVFKKLKNNL